MYILRIATDKGLKKYASTSINKMKHTRSAIVNNPEIKIINVYPIINVAKHKEMNKTLLSDMLIIDKEVNP